MFGLFKSEKTKVKERLKKFQFPKGFIPRLMKEQGWKLNEAIDNINEYLKFLYLAKFHGPVTPSKTVDEVWHLHLIYSDSYWNEMCGKILKMKLHHTPSSGTAEDDRKYKNQYQDTQSAYVENFPSGDSFIWAGSLDSTSDPGHSFGGGHFGGSGAGSDWGGSSHSSCSSHSSGDSSGGGSSCSSSSCGSSCGGGCGGD